MQTKFSVVVRFHDAELRDHMLDFAVENDIFTAWGCLQFPTEFLNCVALNGGLVERCYRTKVAMRS
jgi:hypothetical protein